MKVNPAHVRSKISSKTLPQDFMMHACTHEMLCSLLCTGLVAAVTMQTLGALILVCR